MSGERDTTMSGGTPRTRSDQDAPAVRTTGVVLVADRSRSVTDEIVDCLRDRYTVRAAYSGDGTIESLDADVSAALLDPELDGITVPEVSAYIDRLGLYCQLAILTPHEPAVVVDEPFDDYVLKPIARDAVRRTVDRLVTRTTYRAKLDEYYDLASRQAESDADAAEVRLGRLADELDDIRSNLDDEDAFRAVLDREG